MKLLITGATGMVGAEVLRLCLAQPDITSVISVVRKTTELTDPKLIEVVKTDFFHWDDIPQLHTVDVIVFCLGVYSGSVPDNDFKKTTVDIPVSLAKKWITKRPDGRFILLSGSGVDRTEKSKISFARYKGMAENQIKKLGFQQFTAVRPAYIYPTEKRVEPNVSYQLMRVLYPLIKLFGKRYSITSSELAHAITTIVIEGGSQEVLENEDILNRAVHD